MIAKIAKIAGLCLAFLLVAGASAYLTLTLIIKSEDTVIVPDLVGKDVVSALEVLTDLQLNTKVNGSEYNQKYPKNHVTFQEPEAGSEIKKDRDVRIIISKGAKNILMPNVVTLSDQQARMIFDENGFTRGKLSHTYSSTVEKDHVIVQVPEAGDLITRGAKADILVSSGPRPVKYVMPDLSGHFFDQAVLIIENANLTVGNIRSQFDKQKTRNSIIGQEPLAGYSVNVSSPVHLVINRPSAKADGDRLHRPLYGSLLQHRINIGFLKKRVRVELENTETTTDIFDDYIKPGDEIWVLVPRDHDATVFIFEDDELVRTRMYEAW
ncbi:Serine/threonine protein kinase [Olavius sp. associated proteobacterium Delta 1]|nr:Serine/threonine protein kinase [Olavius sp. associated proteobacterium Delta 1]